MKSLHSDEKQRDTSATDDAQPKIIKTWLQQIVGRLVSHSPRMMCTNCSEEFFAAEIKISISRSGVREECPHCHAGSFRLVTNEVSSASGH